MASAYSDAVKWKIEHSGRVSLPVYQTVGGFFYGIAALSMTGRIVVRLAIRRRLYLDDYVLLFGFLSLTAATGFYYSFDWMLYVLNILKYDRTVIPTAEDLGDIMNAQAINYSLVALLWATICPVKLCFLVSFKVLIKNVSRIMSIWYWTTVGLIIVFWAIMTAMPWMQCPYSGPELLMRCTPEPPRKALLMAIWFSFAFDALTDVMIVAIPIWILRHVRIELRQKLGIAVFLCLSVVMIAVSLLRCGLSFYRGWGDLPTQYMLYYLEACIAITMAAIASYRAVFVERTRRQELVQQRLRSPEETPDTIRARVRKLRKAAHESDLEETRNAPRSYIPRQKYIGSRLGGLTFLRGTQNSTDLDSLSATELGTVSSGFYEEPRPSAGDSMTESKSKEQTTWHGSMDT
ncbi:hypothetical protein BDV95DRAFT_623236 [Massariosphaeria phaeospora]|uniref:Rhodopsin domain-containing protein n=1 Tax=Massariosphaeria phaeospora TaxID=100035 RepID=A0A7C8I281_9PLEO|nr:hypothetical protein BDV95DRAFT_623236 [Massariosphaeria phaeospora]